ncbi:MAG: class I SAM-dependent methyltransferase [candidate division Zixibacteria bacterium]|nr:class I SAM-dependent methyltransferase [candidate division Zixibacteria bacterium]
MTDDFNTYEDSKRAEAYAGLEFPGTYYLAYRDLPEIITEHAKGKKAIDFGCGTGRSTRFLRKLGFDGIGVDISEDMLSKAGEIDPEGQYHLVDDGDLSREQSNTYDLALSVFTFDNIPTFEKKVKIFRELARLIKSDGRIVSLVSSPEIYKHEWASFTTKDFPENKQAKSGDIVKIIMKDVEDKRPVEDIIWSHESYQDIYAEVGLQILAKYEPLGKEDESYDWLNETTIAPWVIYVLEQSG